MADELKQDMALPSSLTDAKGKEWSPPTCPWPRRHREYNGFPYWVILRAMPGREERSASWLTRRDHLVYLPTFCKQVRSRGHQHRARLYAMLPGLMFAPNEIMDIARRDDVFELAGIQGWLRAPSGAPALLTKAEVEIIREIEGKLNVPAQRPASVFAVGQKVRFTKALYAAFWGTGTVFEVASESRIGVEVEQAIGSCCKVYVPASEIEAM